MTTPTHRDTDYATHTPDWVHMLDAHANKGIPAQPRPPEAVAARQAAFSLPSRVTNR